MDDVRGRFLGLPHGTTPAAVTTNKNIKMSSFKSSENIQKKKVNLSDLIIEDTYPFIQYVFIFQEIIDVNHTLIKKSFFTNFSQASEAGIRLTRV